MTVAVEEIPYGQQWIEAEDVEAVAAVLRSDRITQGPAVEAFERALAARVGAGGAVAVSSGTAALHLACLAAGVGPGWEVVTSPISFVASANCALYCGARPAFVDIDPTTRTMDPDRLEQYLRTAGRARRAVLPVHFAGHPCRLDAIADVAAQYGAVVLEDAAHALGAEWRGSDGAWRLVGSGSHAAAAVFSFHPVKHITTGEGGLIASNDAALLGRAALLRSHGITRDRARMEEDHGPWYYEMQELGFNYRITDLQCALGHRQLRRLDEWVARRRAIARRYTEALAGLPGLATPVEQDWVRAAWHLYVVELDDRRVDRRDLVARLAEQGVRTQVHYIPIYLQPYYRRLGFKPGMCPAAEVYYQKALSLPIYPRLTEEQVEQVIRAVKMTVEVGWRA